MTRFVTVPMVNVNDETAILIEWLKGNKTLVNKGEIIAVIETSKATVDLEAEDSGYLNIVVHAGAQIPVGEVIAALCDSIEEIPEIPKLQNESQEERTSERRITKKAEILAVNKRLDLNRLRAEIPGTGTINEAEVAAYLERGGAGSTGPGTQDLVDDVYPRQRRQRLLIVGGGLGAVQVLDSLSRIEHQRATAIIDDNGDLKGKTVLGVPILGGQEEIEGLFHKGLFDAVVISVSTSIEFRSRIAAKLSALNIPMANVIDPSARIQLNAELGVGNVVLAYCQIGSCAMIGNGNFLSPFVDVEHHCTVGDFCTFGPGVMMSSLVKVGSHVKFGTGIFIEPKLTIGADSIVGSGAILTRNIPPNSIVKTKANYTVRTRSITEV